MSIIDIYQKITPARRKALIAISKTSYYNVRSNWKSRGRPSIQGMVVDWLINNNLVKKVEWKSNNAFGHRLVLTFSGRMALALVEKEAV